MKYQIINSEEYCDIIVVENFQKSSTDFPIGMYEINYQIQINWKESLKVPIGVDELFIIVPAKLRVHRKDVLEKLYSEFRKFVDCRIIITLVCKIDGKFVVLYSK